MVFTVVGILPHGIAVPQFVNRRMPVLAQPATAPASADH
jgi:hypothetical protein